MPCRFFISFNLTSLVLIKSSRFSVKESGTISAFFHQYEILFRNGQDISSSRIKYILLPCPCDYDFWPLNLVQTTLYLFIYLIFPSHIFSQRPIHDNHSKLSFSVGHSNVQATLIFKPCQISGLKLVWTTFILRKLMGVTVLVYTLVIFELMLKYWLKMWEDLSSKPLD